MSDVKSDIEIAREAKMKPIMEIGKTLGIPEKDLIPYGHTKAKVSPSYIDTLAKKKDGKLILVTAINPTPAGDWTSVCICSGWKRPPVPCTTKNTMSSEQWTLPAGTPARSPTPSPNTSAPPSRCTPTLTLSRKAALPERSRSPHEAGNVTLFTARKTGCPSAHRASSESHARRRRGH